MRIFKTNKNGFFNGRFNDFTMEFVYFVTEANIETRFTYPFAYKTYSAAAAAVKEKWIHELKQRAIQNNEDLNDLLRDIEVPEHTSGVTNMYVEKENYITVYRLPIMQNS
jgi:hypothetical protein